ncbi:MAG: hypothetical protein M1825_002553 [Sarcosagium campestre]|nr:MAG: hypothetical protein M1825_002553 [Sarcosagium campestre]
MSAITAKTTPPAPPSLSFPPATFAKLSPSTFLQAHVDSADPVRPNGRKPSAFRPPTINSGSLTYADGSAVVRTGDTAVVCGVRAEILRACDITGTDHEYRNGSSGSISEHEVAALGLLVPNLELATGCSPANLPGQPPSTLAQTLSSRLLALLHSSRLVAAEDLRIQWRPPPADAVDAPLEEKEQEEEVKAYWTLYIDILFISLDGNAFDAAWAAIVAALADTRLPHAYWDVDRELVLCDPAISNARTLRLRGLPIASTFVAFAKAQTAKQVVVDGRQEGMQAWILADPDDFEEALCRESVTIVVDCSGMDDDDDARTQPPPRLLRLEKGGGSVIDARQVKELVGLAVLRWEQWRDLLRPAGSMRE